MKTITTTLWRLRFSSSHTMAVKSPCKLWALVPDTTSATISQCLLGCSVKRPGGLKLLQSLKSLGPVHCRRSSTHEDGNADGFQDLLVASTGPESVMHVIRKATLTAGGNSNTPVSYTHLTLPTTPYV